MSTNLEYRAWERQKKRDRRRQASETQREKGRQRSRAIDKKTKETFFVPRTTWKFCNGGDKMRNATGHQCNENILSETKICKRRAPASPLYGSPPGEANHHLFHLIFRNVNDFRWQVSRWEMMVSWHSCAFISWEKSRELTHFIFLLSLKLHDSKFMLNFIICVCVFFLLWYKCSSGLRTVPRSVKSKADHSRSEETVSKSEKPSYWNSREDKGDREGIPHTHPIP